MGQQTILVATLPTRVERHSSTTAFAHAHSTSMPGCVGASTRKRKTLLRQDPCAEASPAVCLMIVLHSEHSTQIAGSAQRAGRGDNDNGWHFEGQMDLSAKPPSPGVFTFVSYTSRARPSASPTQMPRGMGAVWSVHQDCSDRGKGARWALAIMMGFRRAFA